MRGHRWLLPLDLLVGLFALSAAVLGVFPSYNPELSYTVQAGVLLGCAVYFVVAHGPTGWDSLRWIGHLLMLAGTGVAALVVLQYAYLSWGESPPLIQRAGHLTTLLPDLGIPYWHPNAAATFLEIMIPLGIALAFSSRRLLRFFWALGTLLCLYALVLTFSRGAWVGLGVTFFVAVIVLARPRPVRIGAAVLLVVGSGGVLLSAAGGDWALSRWILYRNSLFVAGDYAFTGIGLGDTFPLVYSRYGLLIQVLQLSYPHNLFLSVWMGQGLPGLAAFGGLIVTLYLMVRRVIRSAKPHRLFHAAWLGVTAALIHSLFDSRYYVESWWLLPSLFGLIGLAAAAGRIAMTHAVKHDAAVPTRYFPLRHAASISAALLVGALVFNTELRAAWYTNLGALAETRAELGEGLTDTQRAALNSEAQDYYQRALALNPDWPNANRRSGWLAVKLEDFAQAVAPLEAAYRSEPINPAAIKGLGLAYVWNGQTEDAARMFLLLDDPQAMAEELLVWGWWRGSADQQPLLSAYAYETSLAMYPDAVSLPVWQAVADAYRSAGENELARQWYSRILEEEPEHAAARQALAQLDET